MIERYLKTPEAQRKWRRFKAKKLALLSLFLLLLGIMATYMAPILANSKPIAMKYRGEIYFPVFKTYSAKEFEITDQLTVNYRNLKLGNDDWQIWPLIKWDPFESNRKVTSYPAPPSRENLLGTDDRGRDVLTRLLYGFRYGIEYALCVWVISFILGTALGGVSGYLGGRFDFFFQRGVEIMSTVPQLLLLIIIISIFTPSLKWLILVSCLFGWINISYYMRAEFLKNRKRDFVEAARSLGANRVRILWRHIFPNSTTPLITFSPFVIANNIFALASLDYLGFGLPIPTPSWGELLNQAYNYFTIAWWLAVYPSLALFGTLVTLNLLGEGLRDTFDPKA